VFRILQKALNESIASVHGVFLFIISIGLRVHFRKMVVLLKMVFPSFGKMSVCKIVKVSKVLLSGSFGTLLIIRFFLLFLLAYQV